MLAFRQHSQHIPQQWTWAWHAWTPSWNSGAKRHYSPFTEPFNAGNRPPLFINDLWILANWPILGHSEPVGLTRFWRLIVGIPAGFPGFQRWWNPGNSASNSQECVLSGPIPDLFLTGSLTGSPVKQATSA